MKAISFVGYSNSGKTQIICQLLEWFSAQDVRVAVIKHSHKTGLGDEHKDTGRFRRAGARMVALAAPGVLQVTQTISKDPPLSEVLTLLAPQVDVILVEGYKSSFLPKVAVLGPESVEVPDFPKIIALVASQPPVTSLPVFHPQAVEALGKFLRQFLGFP